MLLVTFEYANIKIKYTLLTQQDKPNKLKLVMIIK